MAVALEVEDAVTLTPALSLAGRGSEGQALSRGESGIADVSSPLPRPEDTLTPALFLAGRGSNEEALLRGESRNADLSSPLPLRERSDRVRVRDLCRLLPVACGLLVPLSAHAALYVFVVSGLGGEPQYEERFQSEANAIVAAAHSVTEESRIVELSGNDATRAGINNALARLSKSVSADDALFAIFIGHGSFDGEEYRYNVPGLDPTGTELAAALNLIPARQQIVVNTTSSSGAIVDLWKRDGRILITATKNGGERNATRFAEYWVKALKTPEADTDKNGTITVAEAYAFANSQVVQSFASQTSLATEHARLEGKGAERFAIARIEITPDVSTDPALAALYEQRDAAEKTLDALKRDKTDPAGDTYYGKLETALLQIARADRDIDQHIAALPAPARGKP
jgi:hypothetical protein